MPERIVALNISYLLSVGGRIRMKDSEKEFDCVEMKREGAKRVMALIAGMTKEEQLAFWKEEHRKLVEHKQQMSEKSQSRPD